MTILSEVVCGFNNYGVNNVCRMWIQFPTLEPFFRLLLIGEGHVHQSLIFQWTWFVPESPSYHLDGVETFDPPPNQNILVTLGQYSFTST